jgi:hypothetical protein
MSDGGDGHPPDFDDAPFPEEDEILAGLEDVQLSPTEHQRLKDLVNDDLAGLKNYDRRYLVVGAGGTSGAATRRMTVYDLLDARSNPPATAFRLEEYGLTPDDIRLWVRAFDILCGRASHIVAVIEDFDGSYVWEMGLIFAPGYRDKGWLLKRTYDDPEVERERYDNGMAISHVKLMLTGPRCQEWADTEELQEAVAQIP